MKRYMLVLMTALVVSGSAIAADAEVNANAGVQAETESGFFSRTWGSVKGFFGGGEAETTAEAEAPVEASAEKGSMIDSAAESTKAGVDWTADKTKKGAEWTKETAIDVKDGTVAGAKSVGGAVADGAVGVGNAVKGIFTSDTAVEVDAEASAEAK